MRAASFITFVRARRAERVSVMPLVTLGAIVALVGQSWPSTLGAAALVAGPILWDYRRWRDGRIAPTDPASPTHSPIESSAPAPPRRPPPRRRHT